MLYWMMIITNIKTIRLNTYPKRLTVRGRDRIPAPITVFIIVVTLSKKSEHK